MCVYCQCLYVSLANLLEGGEGLEGALQVAVSVCRICRSRGNQTHHTHTHKHTHTHTHISAQLPVEEGLPPCNRVHTMYTAGGRLPYVCRGRVLYKYNGPVSPSGSCSNSKLLRHRSMRATVPIMI